MVLDAFRFRRAPIIDEAPLTRLVRAILRQLKRDLLKNSSLTVAVEFGAAANTDGLEAMPIATLPALVLSGPRVRPNRFYATNVVREEVVEGPAGPELRRRRPAFTADLGFEITGSSRSTAELLNLMAAAVSFFNRNPWVSMERIVGMPEHGYVRWEMVAEGDVRVALDGRDDLRAFTYGFVVQGFDVDPGQIFDLGRAMRTAPALSIATPQGGTE